MNVSMPFSDAKKNYGNEKIAGLCRQFVDLLAIKMSYFGRISLGCSDDAK